MAITLNAAEYVGALKTALKFTKKGEEVLDHVLVCVDTNEVHIFAMNGHMYYSYRFSCTSSSPASFALDKEQIAIVAAKAGKRGTYTFDPPVGNEGSERLLSMCKSIKERLGEAVDYTVPASGIGLPAAALAIIMWVLSKYKGFIFKAHHFGESFIYLFTVEEEQLEIGCMPMVNYR